MIICCVARNITHLRGGDGVAQKWTGGGMVVGRGTLHISASVLTE
jgi:hypothetical protein